MWTILFFFSILSVHFLNSFIDLCYCSLGFDFDQFLHSNCFFVRRERWTKTLNNSEILSLVWWIYLYLLFIMFWPIIHKHHSPLCSWVDCTPKGLIGSFLFAAQDVSISLYRETCANNYKTFIHRGFDGSGSIGMSFFLDGSVLLLMNDLMQWFLNDTTTQHCILYMLGMSSKFLKGVSQSFLSRRH